MTAPRLLALKDRLLARLAASRQRGRAERVAEVLAAAHVLATDAALHALTCPPEAVSPECPAPLDPRLPAREFAGRVRQMAAGLWSSSPEAASALVELLETNPLGADLAPLVAESRVFQSHPAHTGWIGGQPFWALTPSEAHQLALVWAAAGESILVREDDGPDEPPGLLVLVTRFGTLQLPAALLVHWLRTAAPDAWRARWHWLLTLDAAYVARQLVPDAPFPAVGPTRQDLAPLLRLGSPDARRRAARQVLRYPAAPSSGPGR